jgi:D-alanyl-D-alanine carboxypeptidase (penicillin-binding protein 5/6)
MKNDSEEGAILHRLKALLLLILLIAWPASGAKAMSMPSISAQSAALIDLKTGTILAGINTDQRVYPASTIKVLTALLVLENSAIDDSVTISRRAQDQEGTSLYTREGEAYPVKDLLYAMLVQSCNDAAVALAEHVAGSVEAFAEMMNQRAAQLGARNSHFVNPSGLHDDQNYTTAADMALIFAGAMKNQTIRDITTTRIHWVTIGSGEERLLVSGNDLLVQYSDSVVGGKTGYTPEAGQTLLTGMRRGNMEVGVVVFKAQGKAIFTDAARLLDYAFSEWRTVPIVAEGQSVTATSVRYGQPALLVADRTALLTVPADTDLESLKRDVQLDDSLQAPLAKGAIVGSVTYLLNGEEIANVPLRVATAIPRAWYTYWQVPLVLAVGYLGLGLRHRLKPSTHPLEG